MLAEIWEKLVVLKDGIDAITKEEHDLITKLNDELNKSDDDTKILENPELQDKLKNIKKKFNIEDALKPQEFNDEIQKIANSHSQFGNMWQTPDEIKKTLLYYDDESLNLLLDLYYWLSTENTNKKEKFKINIEAEKIKRNSYLSGSPYISNSNGLNQNNVKNDLWSVAPLTKNQINNNIEGVNKAIKNPNLLLEIKWKADWVPINSITIIANKYDENKQEILEKIWNVDQKLIDKINSVFPDYNNNNFDKNWTNWKKSRNQCLAMSRASEVIRNLEPDQIKQIFKWDLTVNKDGTKYVFWQNLVINFETFEETGIEELRYGELSVWMIEDMKNTLYVKFFEKNAQYLWTAKNTSFNLIIDDWNRYTQEKLIWSYSVTQNLSWEERTNRNNIQQDIQIRWPIINWDKKYYDDAVEVQPNSWGMGKKVNIYLTPELAEKYSEDITKKNDRWPKERFDFAKKVYSENPNMYKELTLNELEQSNDEYQIRNNLMDKINKDLEFKNQLIKYFKYWDSQNDAIIKNIESKSKWIIYTNKQNN